MSNSPSIPSRPDGADRPGLWAIPDAGRDADRSAGFDVARGAALGAALGAARAHLLAAREPAGHWVGHLSSSALSTATAAFAVGLFADHSQAASAELKQTCRDLATAGHRWLIANQNADGGFGDTTDSPSNISTTTLCWAALAAAAKVDAAAKKAFERAGDRLVRWAGSTEPEKIAAAISARYGDDRTFSAPILTHVALAGLLGPEPGCWDRIAQLPFELAACPQSLFRFLGLPVVSYALPALIAIGLVHHRRRPTRNPFARVVRALTTGRVLRVLRSIQPTGGGFLEAAPLTSFVLMSLAGMGQADHDVAHQAAGFLIRSARPDGSWPIDTNLATWVSTLSISALHAGGHSAPDLTAADRAVLRSWILGQQYKIRHPYTGAPAGAFAWTNLPGGVPDADDTAGALLALHHLGPGEDDASITQTRDAAIAAIGWLLDVQNRDGGIPTFCRGWGKLPFDRSAPDLTAHAIAAWDAWRRRQQADPVAGPRAASLQLPADLIGRIDAATTRALGYMLQSQQPGGAWIPLWFGNQANIPSEQNPVYGTARVLQALAHHPNPPAHLQQAIGRATQFLLTSQNLDGGWGGAQEVCSTLEETGHAVQALLGVHHASPADPALEVAARRGVEFLLERARSAGEFPCVPIGLYFANLWYWERLYPVIAVTGALTAWARSASSTPNPGQ